MAQNTGVLGFFARRIFGAHPTDEETDDEDLQQGGIKSAEAKPAVIDNKEEVGSLKDGISGKEESTDQYSPPDRNLTVRPGLESSRPEEGIAHYEDQSPPQRELGSHAIQLSPGDSASYATSPADSSKRFPQGQSHPVDLSPSLASNISSFASSPQNPIKTGPSKDDSLSRWKDLDEQLTPRSLHLAMEQSKGRFGDSDDSELGFNEDAAAEATPSAVSSPDKVASKPMVAPIKTKAISPPHVASSPTHDIVDNLLGAIVGSHLTKDKASGSSPVQTTLNRGQEKLGVMPGERSGELQLLSTGKEPQTVPAVPKNIPLPSSKPESDTPKSSSQHASPFLASSSAPVAGSPPQTMRYQGLPAHFIDRDQERTQLYVGKLPGQFDVETPEGSSAYHITSLEEGGNAQPSIASPDSGIKAADSLTAEPPANFKKLGISSGKGQASSESADLDAAERGSSPLASDTPSRKRLREPEGPFAVTGPPSYASKTSEATSSPGIAPTLSLDNIDHSDVTGPKTAAGDAHSAPEKGSSPEPEAPTAAESLTASGQPVSHPSGTTPGLTPSNAQIAEARSLAGGKVDPITGHSTLNASQLGLPQGSAELIDAAVDDTNIDAPQPVGAYSSAVAVKPTSGTSTDLNKILDNSRSGQGSANAAINSTIQPGKAPAEESTDILDASNLAASLNRSSAEDLTSVEELGYQNKSSAGLLDEPVPLEEVKREATQASAAPVLNELMQSEKPTQGKSVSEASAEESGDHGHQDTAPGVEHGANGGPSAATKRVFGTNYGQELSKMEPQGNWKDSESQKSGSPLDDRFHGAWGEDSNHQQDPSTSQPLFKAAVSGKGPLLGEQIAGPIGAGRHMDDNSSTQAIKSDPYESSERSVNPVAGDTLEAAPGQTPSGVIYNPAENPEGISGHPQAGSSDPALGPIQDTSGHGLSIPQGSAVPEASLASNRGHSTTGEHHSGEESRQPGSSFDAGQPSEAGPGLTSQPSKDVNLAKPREGLPSVNVSSPPSENPRGNASQTLKGFFTGGDSKSQPRTPKSAIGVQPTSIESPMMSLDGQFPGQQEPQVEGRHVDYAAENAKRALAAIGLGSLTPSFDSGSQRLKTSMGLPSQPTPPSFRSNPSDVFPREEMFPPAGQRDVGSQSEPQGPDPFSFQHPSTTPAHFDQPTHATTGAGSSAVAPDNYEDRASALATIDPTGLSELSPQTEAAKSSSAQSSQTTLQPADAAVMGAAGGTTPEAYEDVSSAERPVPQEHPIEAFSRSLSPVSSQGYPAEGLGQGESNAATPTSAAPQHSEGHPRVTDSGVARAATEQEGHSSGGLAGERHPASAPAHVSAQETGPSTGYATSRGPEPYHTEAADHTVSPGRPALHPPTHHGARDLPEEGIQEVPGPTTTIPPPLRETHHEQLPSHTGAPEAISAQQAAPLAEPYAPVAQAELGSDAADHPALKSRSSDLDRDAGSQQSSGADWPSIDYEVPEPAQFSATTAAEGTAVPEARAVQEVPPTHSGQRTAPMAVMYEDDYPPAAAPDVKAPATNPGSDQSGGLAGLRPLLSEEAGMKEQVKAARAAEFDTKVQSGLEEVEPEPDAADIKTAAPAAPTAAKAEAVDTPFSPKKHPKAHQDLAEEPTEGLFHDSQGGSLAPEAHGGHAETGAARALPEQEKAEARVQSTGSGGFDAYIDREASEGDKPQDAAQQVARASTNLPASHQSKDMPGASLEDSAVGEACKISSDPEDKAETTTKPKATTRHLSSPGGVGPVTENLTTKGEVVDEKIESPRPGSAKQAGNTSRPAAQAATIAEIDKADAPSSRKELFSENEKPAATPKTSLSDRTPPRSPFAENVAPAGQGTSTKDQGAGPIQSGENPLFASGGEEDVGDKTTKRPVKKPRASGKRTCGCFGPTTTVE